MSRRAWKLQEFVAHSPGVVTCLAMGHKSARVMATGGEDRKVKLWAVGNPSCIMSLGGHTSSVDSAQFSQNEDCIAAGSLSGSIRVWDLEQEKMMRVLAGHTSSVQSLDFHPHGNFIASGSLDSTVRLWDVSRKGCINTFRGHTACVNMVRFSPDGNWVISAGDDCRVKVWDLAEGKMLAELTGHTAPVTCIAYHPTVLLLATASADRTVRIFDLENFTQVSVSGVELAASAVRRLAFHPEGVCLYVATTEHLKIYNYETMSCLDTVAVGWRSGGGLVDMAVAHSYNQLVGASISQSLVSTFVVDVKSCVPFVSPLHSAFSSSLSSSPPGICDFTPPSAAAEMDPRTRPLVRSGSDLDRARPSSSTFVSRGSRKTFCLQGNGRKPHVESDDGDPPDVGVSGPDAILEDPVIDDPAAYNRIFKPKHVIARSPSRSALHSSSKTNEAPPEDGAPSCSRPMSVKPPRKLASQQPQSSDDDAPFYPPPAAPRVESPPAPRPAHFQSPPTKEQDTVKLDDFIPNKAPPQCVDPFAGLWNMMGSASTAKDSKLPHKDESSPREPATKAKQAIAASGDATANNSGCSNNEAAIIQQLRVPHASFMSVLSARHKSLTTVRLMWPRENLRTALESAILMQDQAVFVDVLRALITNSKLWNLDLVALLLPQLTKLVWSKYSVYVETACQAIRVILRNFASLIRQTVNSAHALGVDISLEERQEKCRACLSSLESIRSAFESKEVTIKAGQCGREVVAMFSLLE
ncbi:hypothetical protein AAHC03_013406 [Spirometra sp. Aus1]